MKYLFLPAILMLLCGCQWPESMLEGNASVQVFIRNQNIGEISAVTASAMKAGGYVPEPGYSSQEETFGVASPGSPGNRIMSFIHDGQDRIWIVAQPSAEGWYLYCLPEPAITDTSFARWKFKGILESVRKQCEARAHHPGGAAR